MNAELRQVDRDCCRKAYLTPGNRENPSRIYDYPVRVTDIDLFDYMKNASSRTTCPRHRRCSTRRCG